MKTHRQRLFDYFAQEHGISLMDSDYNELDSYAAAVEAEKTVIKAKALRKKGTNEWYYFGKMGWTMNEELILVTDFAMQQFAPIPVDAELIDIEISYQPEEMGNG